MLIEVDFGYITPELEQYAMYNLSTIPLPVTDPTFHGKVAKFLDQFNSLHTRWKRTYEPDTESILTSAADFQVEILEQLQSSAGEDLAVPVPVSNLERESTVIALAFSCLIFLRDKSGISFWMLHSEIMDDTLVPEITITRHEEGKTENLAAEISHIAKLPFRLLDTQDPRHWPTVLYALMILYLIEQVLGSTLPFMEKMEDAPVAVHQVFKDLARYYYVCTNGGGILNRKWDADAYAAAVRNGTLPVEYPELLRDLWIFDSEFPIKRLFYLWM
ncbi:hypothetical protein BJX70DRAFT_404470 [Aspergillus crustosus]